MLTWDDVYPHMVCKRKKSNMINGDKLTDAQHVPGQGFSARLPSKSPTGWFSPTAAVPQEFCGDIRVLVISNKLPK